MFARPGHRSLTPDNPRLKQILEGAAKGSETLSDAELQRFDAVFDVDITCTREGVLQQVITNLDACGFLKNRSVLNETSAARAAAAAQGLESRLRSGVAPAAASRVGDASGLLQDGLPLYWEVNLAAAAATPPAQAIWQKLLAKAPDNLREIPDVQKHVTLLFAGGAKSNEAAAKRLNLTPSAFEALRKRCEERVGQEVSIVLRQAVQDDDVACVEVDLPCGMPCAGQHPHVTVAHSSRVGPVHSNVLLARAAAVNSANSGGPVSVEQLGKPYPRLRGIVQACWPKR